MHDIDRTLNEIDHDYANEYDQEFNDEFEFEADYEQDEYQDEFNDEFEFEAEAEEEMEYPEHYEMEFAEQLLEIGSDQELEQFLGSLIPAAAKLLPSVGRAASSLFKGGASAASKIARTAGRAAAFAGREAKTFYNSPTGRDLRKRLAGAIRKGVPYAGKKIGCYVGNRAGKKLGNWGAGLLGYEMEISQDQELDIARNLVRMATDATHKAMIAAKNGSPNATSMAVKNAFQKMASAQGGKKCSCHKNRKGTWIRTRKGVLLIGY